MVGVGWRGWGGRRWEDEGGEDIARVQELELRARRPKNCGQRVARAGAYLVLVLRVGEVHELGDSIGVVRHCGREFVWW